MKDFWSLIINTCRFIAPYILIIALAIIFRVLAASWFEKIETYFQSNDFLEEINWKVWW